MTLLAICCKAFQYFSILRLTPSRYLSLGAIIAEAIVHRADVPRAIYPYHNTYHSNQLLTFPFNVKTASSTYIFFAIRHITFIQSLYSGAQIASHCDND